MMRSLLLMCAALVSWPAIAEPQLLRAEQAFRYTAEARDGAVVLHWDVADGYYLYQKRFGFRSLDPAAVLGEPQLPRGDIHEDEFFGKSYIHRGRFEILIPLIGSPAGGVLPLEIKSQGCADIGICLPPQTWKTELQLSAARTPAAEPDRKLLSLLSGGRSAPREFLPPEQAFRLSAARENGQVAIRWQIAPGYYLYREQFGVSADGEPLSAEFPPGVPKHDEFFGEVEVFYESASTRVEAPAGARQLEVRHQGCAEDGICYPPTTSTITLASLGPLASPAAADGSVAAASPAPVSESDRLAALISGGSLPMVLAVFFGFGLLLAFTPCVLPMVPILSGLIVGQGPDITTRRAFSLSAVFVLAMALSYTAAGVVVALLGHNLQATFQHPVVLASFAAVFVLLALAMFGFYELQLPAGLQTRMAALSNRQRSGTWFGAAGMGVFSALIVGPCVAAPLAAALIVIGATGDPLRGGAALFALSLGMGAPLLAFGASAGRLLPRAGPWMGMIKNLFGILLLGVAVWMLERIVPPAAALALWAGLLFLAAIFLGALDPLSAESGPGRRLAKGLGLMGLLYGAVLLVGAAAGGGNVWQPLAGLRGAGGTVQPATAAQFKPVKSVADLERELRLASVAGRGTLLDFYADWCVDCKRMERYTFPEPEVQAALEGSVLLKADVTANDALDRELMNRFGIFGPPATLFFGVAGEELRPYRLVGFVPPTSFAAHARQAWAGPGGPL